MKYGRYLYKGDVYKSAFERNVARYLDERDINFKYEPYVLWYTKLVPGAVCTYCNCDKVIKAYEYTPDFLITIRDQELLVETKGQFTSKDRKKMLLIMDQYDILDIRMVFQADNKLNKTSTTRYSDWCNKHKIQAYIATNDIYIPENWLT